MFLSLIIGGSITSSIGGSFLLIPESVSIVVVTKKNINNKNAISAIEPALTSGDFLAIYFLINFLTEPNAIEQIAIKVKK